MKKAKTIGDVEIILDNETFNELAKQGAVYSKDNKKLSSNSALNDLSDTQKQAVLRSIDFKLHRLQEIRAKLNNWCWIKSNYNVYGEPLLAIGKDVANGLKKECRELHNLIKIMAKKSNHVQIKDLLKDVYESFDPFEDSEDFMDGEI